MVKNIQWVFFAGNAKFSSMRNALAYVLAEHAPTIVVWEAFSLLREGKRPTLAERVKTRAGLPKLYEYIPIHYPERLPVAGRWLKQFGRRMLAAELNRIMAPFGDGQRIVCYDSPSQHHLVGRLGESLSVYVAIDDRTVTVWGDPIPGEEEDERSLLSKVDRVICVSEPLAATLRARAPAGRNLPIDVLTNGYDQRLFDPGRAWEQPAGLESLPRPRILIAGHVSERIDWDGIRGAAMARPEWTWIFVGPADEGIADRVAAVSRASGARIWRDPPIPLEAVPAWIAHCDACAVPYRLNDFTRASSPLKAIEYLGMGAPVLSTAIPSLTQFGDAIAWVREADGASYASALDALARDGRSAAAVERRRSAVRDQTLANKARQFCALLGVV